MEIKILEEAIIRQGKDNIILEKGDVVVIQTEEMSEGAKQTELAKEMLQKFIDEKRSMSPEDLKKLKNMI